MLSNGIEAFKNWLAEPFHDSMSAWDWGLFVLLILILLGLWKMVFIHIEGGL